MMRKGLVFTRQVEPTSNHQRTDCSSSHLTTFAGGLEILPAPINWNYVFANGEFLRNKTIYITVIIVCLLYLVLIIFARRCDRKDLSKVRLFEEDDEDESVSLVECDTSPG
jgi:hypothetical protein